MKNIMILFNIFTVYFSLLIFEVSWNRILHLKIGSTSEANAIVLSAIMAGLGFGALFFSKRKDKARSLYQKVLMGFLLTSFFSFVVLNYYFTVTYQIYDTLSESYLLKRYLSYLTSAIIIFIPTFFAGGLFPLITDLYIKKKEKIVNQFSNIYAIETFGSALGSVLTGFVFLKYFGQFNTFLLATILLILLYLINLKTKSNSEYETKLIVDSLSKNQNDKLADKKGLSKQILLMSFLFGFASMGTQTLILRVASINLANVSYAFSIATFFVIIGYTIGSYWAGCHKQKLIEEVFNSRYFAKFSLIAFILLLLLILLTANISEWIIIPLHLAVKDNLLRLFLPSALLSFATLLPFSVLTGYMFVVNISAYNYQSSSNIRTSSGQIYFINTLGTTLGPIAVIFLLIPFWGIIKTLIFISGLFLIYTLSLINYHKSKILKLRSLSLLLTIGLVLFLSFLPQVKVLPPSFYLEGKNVDFYQETKEGTIVVGSALNHFRKTYINNSQVIGGSYDAVKAVKILGHIPFFLGLEKPERALVVGFGIGITASTILLHDEIKKLDCVELAGNLINAAHFYDRFNQEIYKSERFKLHEGDGRNFLELSTEKYNIISSDPTHPILGSSNLYTREYFALCKKHLTKQGVITQYLPLHKLTPQDFWGIVSTFNSIFDNMNLWLGHTHAILIGFNDENKLRFDFEKIKEETGKIEDEFLYLNPYSIANNFLFSAKEIKAFDYQKINKDDLSYTEFFTFDSYNAENWTRNMELIFNKRKNSLKHFYNVKDTLKFNKFYNNSQDLIKALIYSSKNDKRKYYQTIYKAYQENSENQELLFLLRLFQKQNGRL